MAPHIVQFRTKSQPLEDIEAALAPVSALTDTKRLVTVSWDLLPALQRVPEVNGLQGVATAQPQYGGHVQPPGRGLLPVRIESFW